MFTRDIAAKIFLDKFHLCCKDLIWPKFYFASQEKKKEDGTSNVFNQLLGTF